MGKRGAVRKFRRRQKTQHCPAPPHYSPAGVAGADPARLGPKNVLDILRHSFFSRVAGQTCLKSVGSEVCGGGWQTVAQNVAHSFKTPPRLPCTLTAAVAAVNVRHVAEKCVDGGDLRGQGGGAGGAQRFNTTGKPFETPSSPGPRSDNMPLTVEHGMEAEAAMLLTTSWMEDHCDKKVRGRGGG